MGDEYEDEEPTNDEDRDGDDEGRDDDDEDRDDDDDDDRDDDDRDDDDDGGASDRSGPPREEYVPKDDERAAKALAFVSDVIRQMEMTCRVSLLRPGKDGEDEINLEIHGEDAGRIIGKKGQVLGALQFLTNRVINRPGLPKRHILVDAEGYRRRRDNSLAAMAKRLGRQAMEDGQIITFEPMNPRDRRVVHLALAKFEGVITKSEGEGEDRRVQIIPVRR